MRDSETRTTSQELPPGGKDKPPRLIFITRAFPPTIGGIEKQNYEIHQSLARLTDVQLVANTRGKRFLPLFLPLALYRLWHKRGLYDAVLLGDGLLSVLAWIFKWFSGKPVLCIVHGLDVTFDHWIYRWLWAGTFLHAPDHLIAVGRQTIRRGEELNIPGQKFSFVPNGVRVGVPTSINEPPGRKDDVETDPWMLLTLGRLVKRKGIAWFISEVMPLLDQRIHYVVAGDGPEQNAIRNAIDEAGLDDRVSLLGVVGESQKQSLMQQAALFVQPNIAVEGDIEGFGLVVLEAAGAGTFVIAAAIEGLLDAIVDGENGELVASGDSEAFSSHISQLLADPDKLRSRGAHAANYVQHHFDWDAIAKNYLELISTEASSLKQREHAQ